MPAPKENPVGKESETRESKIEALQKKIDELVAEREKLKAGD